MSLAQRPPRPTHSLVALLLACAGLLAACGNGDDAPTLPGTTRTQTQVAQSNGTAYELAIQQPENYATATNMPLVITLGDRATFEQAVRATDALRRGGLTPPVLVVDVRYQGQDQRLRDYTYPADPAQPTTGGAPAFDRFLVQELLPALRLQYATDTAQTVLVGHGQAGYFGFYHVLTNSSDSGVAAFNKAVLVSPILDYAYPYMRNQVGEYDSSWNDLPMHLYLSRGENDRQDVITPYREVVASLQRANYPNLKLDTVVYPELGHTQTLLTGVEDGLRAVLIP